jgi:hypothetical protein
MVCSSLKITFANNTSQTQFGAIHYLENHCGGNRCVDCWQVPPCIEMENTKANTHTHTQTHRTHTNTHKHTHTQTQSHTQVHTQTKTHANTRTTALLWTELHLTRKKTLKRQTSVSAGGIRNFNIDALVDIKIRNKCWKIS